MDASLAPEIPAGPPRRPIGPVVAGAALFLLLLLGLSFTGTVYNGIEKLIVQSELQVGGRIALRLAAFVSANADELARLATAEDIRNLNGAISREILEFYREKSDSFEFIALVDREGGLVAATRSAGSCETILADDIGRDRFDRASLAGQELAVGRKSLSLYLLRQVGDGYGNALGYLVARLRNRNIREAILSASLGTTERVNLLDDEWRTVCGVDPTPPIPAGELAGRPYGTYVRGGAAELLVTYLPVAGFNLKLLVTREASEAFGFLGRFKLSLVALLVTFILLSFAAGFTLAGERARTANGHPPDDGSPADAHPDPALDGPSGDRLLYGILRAGNFAADLDLALQRVLDLVIRHFRIERASVMLLNDETDELELAAVRIFDPLAGEAHAVDFTKRVSLFSGEGVAGRVVKEGLPLLIEKGSRDERFKSYGMGGSIDPSIRSIAVVPLKASGDAFGVLNFVNPRDEAEFVGGDLDLLRRVGEEVATLVENSGLYRESVTDPDNGLYLETWFARRLDRELVRLRRHGHPLAVVLARFDDPAGMDGPAAAAHELGFQERRFRLAALADAARTAAGEGAIVARTRSDAEVILLLPRTSAGDALAAAERIAAGIAAREFPEAEGAPAPSVSVGVATDAGHAFRSAEFVRRAGIALAAARQAGGNRAHAYQPGMEPAA